MFLYVHSHIHCFRNVPREPTVLPHVPNPTLHAAKVVQFHRQFGASVSATQHDCTQLLPALPLTSSSDIDPKRCSSTKQKQTDPPPAKFYLRVRFLENHPICPCTHACFRLPTHPATCPWVSGTRVVWGWMIHMIKEPIQTSRKLTNMITQDRNNHKIQNIVSYSLPVLRKNIRDKDIIPGKGGLES